MEQFNSNKYQSVCAPDYLYQTLTDFTRLEKLMPTEKIKNWQATESYCRFKVDGIGEMGLKIAEIAPTTSIKYIGDGKVPFDFYLTIQLEPNNIGTIVYATCDANLNPLLKMMASPAIAKFLEILSTAIAEHQSGK